MATRHVPRVRFPVSSWPTGVGVARDRYRSLKVFRTGQREQDKRRLTAGWLGTQTHTHIHIQARVNKVSRESKVQDERGYQDGYIDLWRGERKREERERGIKCTLYGGVSLRVKIASSQRL